MSFLRPLAYAVAFGWIGWNEPGPVVQYSFEIAPEFTPEQANAIRLAGERWEAAIPRRLRIRFVTAGRGLPATAFSTSTQVELSRQFSEATGEERHGVVGLYTAQYALIGLAVDMEPAEFEHTAAHEMGHVMGLKDDFDPRHEGRLMYAYVSPGDCHGPTPADVREWYRLHPSL